MFHIIFLENDIKMSVLFMNESIHLGSDLFFKWITWTRYPSKCQEHWKNFSFGKVLMPNYLTLKEPGGRNPPPLRHFLLYLCRLLFFRAETSWLFSFKPCARFKTIFIKIGPRVMTRRCVIARWVQRKTDFPLKLHTNRVFCLFCLSGYTSTMFYLIYLVYLE